MNREQLADQVQEDPNMKPHEKEVTFVIEPQEDTALIFSAKRTTTQWFLQNPSFDVLWVLCGPKRRREENLNNIGDDETIYGIKGRLPIGHLKVKWDGRKDNYLSNMLGRKG